MRYVYAILLFLALAPCWGRDLPAGAIQGELRPLEYPFVRMSGKPSRLAPGARIFDVNSRIIQPNVLPASATVIYKLDIRGDLQEIWILSADEIQTLKKQQK